MWFIFLILYFAAGGFVCYFIKTHCEGCFISSFNHDYGTVVAIVTGVFWPIATPFTIAIMLAKKKGGK